MPKRCIGVDIGRSHLRAVQVARTPEGFCLEKAFGMQTRRSTDSLPAIAHSLMSEHGFDRRADVAISLPPQAFFFADIETDAAGLEKIRAAETTGLKDYFPLPADDLVAQVCSVMQTEAGKNSVLVAATSRELLRQELHSLRAGKIQPARITAPMAAAQTTVVMNHPEAAVGLAVILCVEESALSLAVTHDGRMLLVRNLPMFSAHEQASEILAQQTADIAAQEIEITWRRLFGNDPDPGLRIFLVASDEMAALLAPLIQEETEGLVVPVDPCAQMARSEGVEADFPLCIAAGLALRTLQPDETHPIDFLAAYRVRMRPRFRLTKELAVCGALAAAAAAVWIVGLFLQLSSLESRYTELRQQADTVFRQAVPEEQNIVDPTAQLQQRLEAFRKEAAGVRCFNPGQPAPLEILYALSRNTPAKGTLKLHEVLIAADSVRVVGSCDRFETLSEWQRLLETIPGLHVVEVPSPKRDSQSGRVHFTISLSTAQEKA